MLDMGFEPEVRSILSQTCSVRQMVMFSATWPPAVHQLAQEFMDPSPVKVVVGSEDLAANHDVMQIVEVLEDRARDERLQTLLEKYHKSRKNRVLVFVLYKKEASRVENMLQRRGWKAVSISGDKAQNARNQALSQFKDGSCPLLIATDVAARGLDIPHVKHVINFDLPSDVEEYVHRIGRTGRMGNLGLATSFFNDRNRNLSTAMLDLLIEAKQDLPSWLESVASDGRAPSSGRRGGKGRFGGGGSSFGGRDFRQQSGGMQRNTRNPGGGGGGYGSNGYNNSGGYYGNDRGNYGGNYGNSNARDDWWEN